MSVDSKEDGTLRGLEREKLLLEIGQLARPWWRRFGSYAALFPTLLALGAVLQVYRTGFFDLQRERLALRELQLGSAVDGLEQRELQLNDDLAVLAHSRDSMRFLNDSIRAATRLQVATFESLATELDSLGTDSRQRIETMRQQTAEMRARRTEFERDLAKMREEFALVELPLRTLLELYVQLEIQVRNNGVSDSALLGTLAQLDSAFSSIRQKGGPDILPSRGR